MVTFNARDLVKKPKAELFNLLPDRFNIKFDNDTIIETTKRKTIFSRFFWKIHSFYPNLPITEKHHVDYVLKGNPLSSNTHRILLGIIFKDLVYSYNLYDPKSKEHVLQLIYEITNDINNEMVEYAEQDVMSFDILDFIEINTYPAIAEAINKTEPTSSSIANTYKFVSKVIKEDNNLKHNPLVRASKAGLVNQSQLLQCVALRGFLTEVTGKLMPNPVMASFTSGLTEMYQFIAESRAAAKALHYSEAPLQDAEYFARKLQLMCMVIEKIHFSDCGSKKYLEWRVSPPIKDEFGTIIRQSDLMFMIGKYYLDEETNNLKVINGDDSSLYNKVIKLRSSIFCNHSNPHEVCSVCFGELAHNVSAYANIGHLCSATMTQQSSQSVLSIKHLDASATSIKIILNDTTSIFFTVNKSRSGFILKDIFKPKNLKLVISKEDALGLIDILNIENIDNINPSKVSAIEYLDVKYTDNNDEIIMPVCVAQNNRKAILSLELLKYLKIHSWEIDNRNNFVFNMDKWDYTLPVLRLPEMEYSYSDHSHAIASLVESSVKNLADRQQPSSPVSTLIELFNLVNRKLNVNLAALEIIICALMMKSKTSYGLARNSPDAVLGVSDLIIKNRSLGAAFAYEDQASVITDPSSFFYNDRPDSIFDVFLMPEQVIKSMKD